MNNARLFIWIATVALVAIFFVIVLYKNVKRKATKKAIQPYLFIFPVMLVLIVMYGYPLVDSIVMSFQNYKLSQPNNVHFNDFENFIKLFQDSDMPMILGNSLRYVILSVLFQFLLGLILALALRRNFRGRNVYQSFVFLPWAFSAFVVGLMFRWAFNGEYGVVNDMLLNFGIISDRIAWLGNPDYTLYLVIFAMVWVGVPFFAIMILASLQSIPREIDESANLDGIGPFSRFFFITLPFIKPTIIMTILLRTIWVFNSFDFIVIITGGGPANSSQTLPSYMYTRAFSSYDFGLASALGVFLILILSLYALFFLKVTNYNKAGDF